MDDFFREETENQVAVGEEQKRQREQLVRSYKKTFASSDGQLVLADLIRIGNVFGNTFRSENTKVQDFLEGRRSLVLYVLSKTEMEDLDKIKNLKE